MAESMSGAARGLYVTLGVLTVITVLVSIQPSISLRQVRNLTILSSYAVGIALLFADRWVRPTAVWVGIGLFSGLLYFGYEVWSSSRAKQGGQPGEQMRPSGSTVLLGVVAWPVALPEVIEYTLADLGVIGSGDKGGEPTVAPRK
jgi:hypothetical protein